MHIELEIQKAIDLKVEKNKEVSHLIMSESSYYELLYHLIDGKKVVIDKLTEYKGLKVLMTEDLNFGFILA